MNENLIPENYPIPEVCPVERCKYFGSEICKNYQKCRHYSSWYWWIYIRFEVEKKFAEKRRMEVMQ